MSGISPNAIIIKRGADGLVCFTPIAELMIVKELMKGLSADEIKSKLGMPSMIVDKVEAYYRAGHFKRVGWDLEEVTRILIGIKLSNDYFALTKSLSYALSESRINNIIQEFDWSAKQRAIAKKEQQKKDERAAKIAAWRNARNTRKPKKPRRPKQPKYSPKHGYFKPPEQKDMPQAPPLYTLEEDAAYFYFHTMEQSLKRFKHVTSVLVEKILKEEIERAAEFEKYKDDPQAFFKAHKNCYIKEAQAMVDGKNWRNKNKCVKLPGDD